MPKVDFHHVDDQTERAKMNKKQIMDANRFKAELVKMRRDIEEAVSAREYDEFKRRTDEAIARINSKIRASNDES